jgi:hypothetical protein
MCALGRAGSHVLCVLVLWATGQACQSLEHRAERTALRADVLYGIAEDDGDDDDSWGSYQRHQQYGGHVEIRHERGTGFVGGGRVTVLQGEVLEARDFGLEETEPPTYVPCSFGGWLGADWRRFGFEVALSGVRSWPPIPAARLRTGDLDVWWVEVALLPDDPLLYFNFLSAGAGVRGDAFRARAGATMYGRLMLKHSEHSGDILTPGYPSSGLPYGAYVDVEYDLPSRLGLGLSAVLGSQPAGRFGVIWRFE